jgi:hypothetical protein
MIFICEQCRRFLGPTGTVYQDVYRNRPLCLNCRQASGEKFPVGSKARIILDFEKRAIICASGLPGVLETSSPVNAG